MARRGHAGSAFRGRPGSRRLGHEIAAIIRTDSYKIRNLGGWHGRRAVVVTLSGARLGNHWAILEDRLELSGNKPEVLAVHVESRAALSASWRERCFDLVVTIVALPVLAVVAAAIALAIYIDSPGPVIYRSLRVGRGGELFEMLKFRKMRREAASEPVTLDHDERFTPIGRFLAATRLDELPQVVNVLRGEMRLVGPRPELEYFVDQFADQYAEIVTVTPGITGNAQLQFIDEKSLLSGPSPATTYSRQVLPVKIEIDLAYVRRHSVAGDLLILGRTAMLPLALLAKRGRARSSAVRLWLPSVAAAGLLALAFILISRHLP